MWFATVLSGMLLLASLLVWFLREQGLERADKWAGVLFGGVGATAAAVGLLAWLWRLGHPGDPDDALTWLADTQREQWSAEQAARRVRDPWPLNLRWLSTARTQAVMASWASVRGTPDPGPIRLDGDYGRMAGLFDGPEAPKRLVVLGAPGAGKSMLVLNLALQLLSRRDAREPVPVLLSAANWNPVLSWEDWLAEQLTAIDRRLARAVRLPDGGRRTLARDLVARGLILPVLDGLDEMDEKLQLTALNRLAGAAGAGQRLIDRCPDTSLRPPSAGPSSLSDSRSSPSRPCSASPLPACELLCRPVSSPLSPVPRSSRRSAAIP